MTLPSLPSQGSTDWYPWASAIHTAVGSGSSGTVADASTTVKGVVELATTAEATAGTDSVRAVTPDGLAAVAATKANASHTHTVADLTATGTRDATTVLYGDNTWKTAPTGVVVPTKRTITANYTLVLADASNMVLHSTAATAVTITLPSDAAVGIAQESAIPWRQYGAGQITFAAGSGATMVSRGGVIKSAAQYAEGLVTKVAANTWLLSGDIV